MSSFIHLTGTKGIVYPSLLLGGDAGGTNVTVIVKAAVAAVADIVDAGAKPVGQLGKLTSSRDRTRI